MGSRMRCGCCSCQAKCPPQKYHLNDPDLRRTASPFLLHTAGVHVWGWGRTNEVWEIVYAGRTRVKLRKIGMGGDPTLTGKKKKKLYGNAGLTLLGKQVQVHLRSLLSPNDSSGTASRSRTHPKCNARVSVNMKTTRPFYYYHHTCLRDLET